MITGINESKKLTRHISCECKCKFDKTKCNSNQSWNNDKYRCECKIYHICEKDYIWNPTTCICENGKYLASNMNDSLKRMKKQRKKEKKATCKTQNFYVLLTFLLITTALLIAVSIYCYLIKYRAKQKH